MPSPEINLDLGATVQQPFAPSNVGSAPNRDKDMYPMDDIKDPTPCTLMYVKGRTSRTIKVAKDTVMPSRIHHGRPVPAGCVVVKVITIREGHEIEDIDYLMKMRGLKNRLMLKGLLFSGPAKISLSKSICRRLFHHGAQRLRHSYFKHAKACSNLSSINDSSSRSKRPRPSERVSSPRTPGQQGVRAAFSYSRPKVLGEHGEKAAFSSEIVSRPRALGQQGA
jgi:hypothetical protein